MGDLIIVLIVLFVIHTCVSEVNRSSNENDCYNKTKNEKCYRNLRK